MQKPILTLLLFAFYQITFSQNRIIALHPIIGDTIDKNEKRAYLLFPEIDNSTFDFGQIIAKDNATYLHYRSGAGEQMKEIDSLKIKEYQCNISKLSAFYLSKFKTDTTRISKNLNIKIKEPSPLDITFITPEMRIAMEKEARRYNALKGQAEERGLWGKDKENFIQTGGYNEFYSVKARKKAKTSPVKTDL